MRIVVQRRWTLSCIPFPTCVGPDYFFFCLNHPGCHPACQYVPSTRSTILTNVNAVHLVEIRFLATVLYVYPLSKPETPPALLVGWTNASMIIFMLKKTGIITVATLVICCWSYRGNKLEQSERTCLIVILWAEVVMVNI